MLRRHVFATLFVLSSQFVQPIWAQKPPDGEARPPIHVRPDSTSSPTGLSPAQVRHAYGFDLVTNQGAGQTIGIVDAYDDPNIESDFAVFNNKFGLPACTTANGCFRKITLSRGRAKTDPGWGLEISLDVEWSHAVAPQAKILLVEAASSSFSDLLSAVDTAVANGASVVSMSWGGGESSGERGYDSHFNVSGVTFTASSGDSGTGAEYPAASPFVSSVGGTTLKVDSAGNYLGETVWSGSGGGQSGYETEPAYQANYPIPNDASFKRGIPDIAYDADPNTGFSVYDSFRYQGQGGWFQVGGTSAGAPQWAALFAIANSARAALGKSPLSSTDTAIYAAAAAAYATNFADIASGTNGSCGTLCTAAVGFDYTTGLGSPRAQNIVNALVAY